MDDEKTVVISGVSPKLSRRKSAQMRRTEHEKTYISVQNPCSPFYGLSPKVAPESMESIEAIRCRSSVVEHLIGNEEVDSSILSGSTISRKTTDRGAMSEALVAAKLMQLGAAIFTPAFGHDHPFDMIAHWDGHLSRIQVKTARDGDNGCIMISGQGVVDREGGKQYPVITAADCDVIIGFHLETGIAYVVRPVGKTRYQLRRTPPKNGQVVGIMYEQDFRLVSLEQIRPLPRQ